MLAIASAKNVPASSNDSPDVQRALSGGPAQSRDRFQVCPWLAGFWSRQQGRCYDQYFPPRRRFGRYWLLPRAEHYPS